MQVQVRIEDMFVGGHETMQLTVPREVEMVGAVHSWLTSRETGPSTRRSRPRFSSPT